MTKSEIAEKIAALKATLGESEELPEPVEPAVLTKSQIAKRIETLKRSLEDNPIEQEEAEGGFSRRAGQLGRAFLSDIGAASDVPLYSNNIMATYDENPDQQAVWLGRKPENPIVQMAEQLPESAGLGREYEPSQDDTLGKISAFAGRMLSPTSMLPMAGYGNVIEGAAKGLKPAAKALAKDIGMVVAQAAAIKGTPRLTDEGGVPGALEDIAKGIGTGYGLSKTGKGLRRIASTESDIKLPNRNEKKVGHYLGKTIGEENLEDVSRNLKNYKSDIGYEPLTGEIAGDPTFAQFQRAREGVVGTGIAQKQGVGASTIVKALEGAETTKEDLLSVQNYIRDRLRSLEGNVEKEIGTLSPRLEAPESGRQIQEGLYGALKSDEKIRRDITSPMYKELENNTSELRPSNALDVLNNTVVKGKVKKDFKSIKNEMRPEGLTKEDILYKKKYDKGLKEAKMYTGEKGVEAYKNSGHPEPKSTTPTVAELSQVSQTLNDMIDMANRKGAKKRALMLGKVKTALAKDFENVPEQKIADTAYAELSKPVAEITEQKVLDSVVKKLHGKFLMTESRVPGVFINSSAGSIDDANALLKKVGNNSKVMEGVKGYLHNKAALSIIDPMTGKVDVKKLEAFKEKHPGAKRLYPELYNKKLKDIGHAQVMVNRFLKNTEAVSETLYKDVLGETVGKDTKNIMKNLFNEHSPENVGNLVEELSKDASGEKMAALRKETLKYFKKKITNAGAEGEHNVLSYPKMKSFMDSHENALKKVLTPEQIKVVKGVEKIVEGKNKAATQGMAKGSPTNANIVNALDLYQSGSAATGFIRKKLLTLGLGTPWIGEFLREWKTVQLRKNLEILDKAIVDHNYADFLLSTPLKSKKDALDFSSQMKKFSNKRYIPPELTALARREQDNEKD